ncbi:MAG: hypothetical protein WCK75_08850 [Elusimicrobiota bacterium]
MKKIFILLFLGLGQAIPGGAQEFTEQEQAVITACETNISEKIFSPAEADTCLTGLNGDKNEFKLLDKLQAADEPRARYILTNENAIKDLGDFFTDADNEYIIRTGLIVRLESRPCALCGPDLDMGPQPDKLLPWVSKYASDKTELTKTASLSWDTLGGKTTAAISKDAETPEQWADRTITDRQTFLKNWAKANFDKIFPPGAVRVDLVKHLPAIEAIWPYIDDSQRQKIQDAIDRVKEDIKKASSEPNSPQNTATAAKYNSMQQSLDNLSSQSDDDKRAFFNKTFANAAPATGEVPDAAGAKPRAAAAGGSGPVYTLTDKQAAKLGPRMQKVLLGTDKVPGSLSDTDIGRETIAFYAKPGNALKFSVSNLNNPNICGVYNTGDGSIKLNKTYIEEAMQKASVTADQLMDKNNQAAIKKVTTIIEPTFIHEGGGHQQQAAWARANKVPDYYYIGQEGEAFSKGALHVLQKNIAEKAKGNNNYYDQILDSDLERADLLKNEGAKGVGRSIMYYAVPSQEGKAAQNFASYESLKKELALREIAAEIDPSRAKKYYASTMALTQELNSLYPWYKLTIKKSEEEARYFQDSLDKLKPTSGAATTLRVKPVKALP